MKVFGILFRTASGFVVILSVLTVLGGCAIYRELAKTTAAENLANAEATRELGDSILDTWGLNFGAMDALTRGQYGKITTEIGKVIEKMNELSKKTREDRTDYDKGYAVCAVASIASPFVLQYIKLYAPDIVKYIPAFLF